MPLSRTMKLRRTKFGLVCSCSSTCSATMPPSGVYFTAFDSRFSRIWRTRSWSAAKLRCCTFTASSVSSCPFAAVCGRMMASTSRSSVSRSQHSSCSSMAPLSILDMSSTSLIRLSRCCDEVWMVARHSSVLSQSPALSRAICVMPMMALMGVRMSWDIFAKNVLFDWFDCLAMASACCRRSRLSVSFVRSNSTYTSFSVSPTFARNRVSWYQRSSPVSWWRRVLSPSRWSLLGSECMLVSSRLTDPGSSERSMLRTSLAMSAAGMPRMRCVFGLT